MKGGVLHIHLLLLQSGERGLFYLWQQKNIHKNKVAYAAAHNKQVEYFMASKVFMFVIEYRNF